MHVSTAWEGHILRACILVCVSMCVSVRGLRAYVRVCVCWCEHVCGRSVLYASEPVPAGIRKVDLGHKYLISVCCP